MLRPLGRADFPVLGEWLREPLVDTWWHDDPTRSALERKYGPSIDGSDPTQLRLAVSGSEPVGFIQWYCYDDEAEYAAELSPLVVVPPGAYGIDYLVGSPQWRGRGVGRAMIRAALQEIWATGGGVVIVAVNAENRASAAVLEAAGFSAVAAGELEPDNPALGRAHVVYRRTRD